jgi:hypothetical protein
MTYFLSYIRDVILTQDKQKLCIYNSFNAYLISRIHYLMGVSFLEIILFEKNGIHLLFIYYSVM